ncbi:hypothetical protein PR048_015447 [Dryococelus australis]|uniref:Uncharacterized protein n=1 Tax=Dryococelus australis TaxID=614101 RepID=A0ABQ9HGZ9_9NEOP|nr:hypothetical protein PR048_015447 [Dryococelus australis]
MSSLEFMTKIQYRLGTAGAELLACSPPTKANRIQYPAGSLPDSHTWESCRAMPLPAGFLGDLPFPPSFHSGAVPFSPQSPSSAPKTSVGQVNHAYLPPPPGQYKRNVAVQHGNSAIGATVAERLAGTPPTKANRVHSLAGSQNFRKWESCRTMPLVSGFSRGSPVSPAPSFQICSIFTLITLIVSQYLAVKSPPKSLHSLTSSRIKFSVEKPFLLFLLCGDMLLIYDMLPSANENIYHQAAFSSVSDKMAV